jgi:xylan 1,4-beta-xylosidase
MLGGRWPGENNWFEGVNADGTIRADFSGMIAQLKAVKAYGFKPRIVLDDVPPTMSVKAVNNAYGNTEPPADEHVWHAYVEAAVRAMVAAFGAAEVEGWTFRVGTEPDLYPGHWTGTKEQYFAHYDFTVDAVKRVLPKARIGPGNILNPGPAPAGRRPKWGLDIIDHAGSGVNACTGKLGTPIDVFSCSYYVTVGRPTEAFDRSMSAMKQRLAKYPQFKNVPIECGEFAVLHDERGKRLYAGDTTEWSASFFAALADRVYRLNVAQLFEWNSASHDVMHPRGRVIEMLEKMVGGKRVAVDVEAHTMAECAALAVQKDGVLYALLYNHAADRKVDLSEKVHVVLEDPRMKSGARWKLTEWTVDREKASWAYAWKADAEAAGLKQLPSAGNFEGSPVRLYGEKGPEVFKKNAAKYAAMSVTPVTRDEEVTVAAGRFVMDLDMAGHSVRLVRLERMER